MIFRPPQKRPKNPCIFCGGSGVGSYGQSYWTPCTFCYGTGEGHLSNSARAILDKYLNNDQPPLTDKSDTDDGEQA